MLNRFDLDLTKWVKDKSQELAEEWPMGGQAERNLMSHWRLNRPQMVARLERLGILQELAHVLENLRAQTVREYLDSGMGPTDAREQADQDWLLLDPEAPDSPEPDPLDRITTLQTQNS
jgi:hypothetical protein